MHFIVVSYKLINIRGNGFTKLKRHIQEFNSLSTNTLRIFS